jgi:uncharacterized protein (DUF3084 family)
MAAGDVFRAKALELLAQADGQNDQKLKAEFENLAAAFQRLAEQADSNTALTIEFLFPSDEEDKKPN